MPGPITSKMSEGVNQLIKEGVHPATDADDILKILDIERKKRSSFAKASEDKPVKDKTQQKIMETLDGGSKHVDLISRETGFPIEKVSATLSMMELSGLVKNYGSGIWGV